MTTDDLTERIARALYVEACEEEDGGLTWETEESVAEEIKGWERFAAAVLPIVEVSIPDIDTLPKISRKICSAIDEFNLCGVLSRGSDGSEMVYSVYVRKIGVDDTPSLTFKDFADELKQMWNNRSISL